MATYKADHLGFARLMLSNEVARTAEHHAEQFAERLRATAPRVSGEYAGRFTVETGLDALEQDRRAAFVVNQSPQATALEVGSWNIKQPPMPMTQALTGLQAD